MTEKEKVAAGLMYDPNYDPELLGEMATAATKCFEYNNLAPDKIEERTAFMREFLGKTGENFVVRSPFFCDYGYNIEIGENFFSNFNCVILDGAKVKFGDNVCVAPNCGFYTAGHPFDVAQRLAGLEYAKPITVGNNVWIGAGVQVCPGVTIGDNSVIGAGSIVTKDIPANSLAVGNPCRVIRKLD